MAYDYIDIGPSPSGEDCAQVGEIDYRKKAIMEMNAFMHQIEREFSSLFENTSIFMKKKFYEHDFGSYGSVVICYDIDDPKAVDAAFTIEANTPEYWDDKAIEEINDKLRMQIENVQ